MKKKQELEAKKGLFIVQLKLTLLCSAAEATAKADLEAKKQQELDAKKKGTFISASFTKLVLVKQALPLNLLAFYKRNKTSHLNTFWTDV